MGAIGRVLIMHYNTNSERGAPNAVGAEVMAYLMIQCSHLTFCRNKSNRVILL